MATTSVQHLPADRLAGRKSGLSGDRSHDAWRDANGQLRVPLGVTLPATIVVSLGMWAGIILGVKSLFF